MSWFRCGDEIREVDEGPCEWWSCPRCGFCPLDSDDPRDHHPEEARHIQVPEIVAGALAGHELAPRLWLPEIKRRDVCWLSVHAIETPADRLCWKCGNPANEHRDEPEDDE